MSSSPIRQGADPSVTLTRGADQACDRFEAAWKAGQRPRIEDHLAAVPETERSALLPELIQLEVAYRRRAGDQLLPEEFSCRFPALDRAWVVGVLAAAAPRRNAGPGDRAETSRQLGKYLLLQQLGKGGCGTVWKAHDTELDRIVAIKIPDADLISSPVLRERFRREAQAVARLSHTNVVTLFAVDQVGDTPMLVMEYVEGTDLARLVEQSGPLPVGQACDFIEQAALGLQHAHERGLIHRDIKPSNLLLTAQGAVIKVVDLGLARLLRRSEDVDTGLTEPGCVLGTSDFLAPEQARDARSADARSDVYSVGCTLYFLLTGRVPFPGGTATDKMIRHLTEEPPPVERVQPSVPPALAVVVRKMMSRVPEDRYPTAAEVVGALQGMLSTASESPSTHDHIRVPANAATTTDAVTKIVPAPRPSRRRRLAALLLTGLAMLALILLLQPWNWWGDADKSVTPNSGGSDTGKPAPVITNSIRMTLALIPAGEFLIGSPESEPGRFPTEGPRHKVKVPRAFYMGIYEVTQGQFNDVMGYNPSHFTRKGNGSRDYPVEQVSYLVAESFCRRLSALPAEKRAGRVYRLPTEVEWEYACRAGSTTTYYFGDDANELRRHAWFGENSGGQTQQVGQRLPNDWGLYDMHGNVWEWCADWFYPRYYANSAERDPHFQPKLRVVRGGGWGGDYGTRQWCRSASRGRDVPEAATNYHGFRVVLTIVGGP
jgi:formylglycine-generating enzyme required for sulfatase activity